MLTNNLELMVCIKNQYSSLLQKSTNKKIKKLKAGHK